MYITEQPISIFYRYSPKRACLQFSVEGENLSTEEFKVDLFYEVLDTESPPLRVHMNLIDDLRFTLNSDKTSLTFRCRLTDISKNHLGKRFIFGIQHSSFQSLNDMLFTDPVTMLSKQTNTRKRKQTTQQPSSIVKQAKKKTSIRDIVKSVEDRVFMIEKLLEHKE
jgi:hypothetical protein